MKISGPLSWKYEGKLASKKDALQIDITIKKHFCIYYPIKKTSPVEA